MHVLIFIVPINGHFTKLIILLPKLTLEAPINHYQINYTFAKINT